MNWTDYVIILLLAWHFSELLEPHLGGALSSEAVRPWAARSIIFILVLFVGAVAGALVTHFVRLSLFSSVDRLLGLLFGLLRGVVVLGLLAMVCHAVRLHEESWYRNSTLVPYAEHAGNVLRTLVGESKIRASSLTA